MSRRNVAALAALLFGALVTTGCSVKEVDYDGLECPCISGWVCDTATNTCVRPGTADGGGLDAGMREDATMPIDSGEPPVDSGEPPIDSGEPMDASMPEDAGDTDAGMPPVDAGPGATRCDDIHAGRLFCEDFEGSLATRWSDQRLTAGSSAAISGETTYLGSGALRVSTAMGVQEAFARATVLPAMTTGDLYVRSYYYFPSSFAMDAIEFAGIAEASRAYHLISTTYVSSSDVHTHNFPADMRQSGMMAIPRDRWVCVEQHVRFDATMGAIELSYDGAMVARLRMMDTDDMRGLRTIEAGIIWQSEAQVPAVAFVDEIVADTSPIGCDP